MPSHQEELVVSYSARQMYDLVANIENYPDFIPWCEALRIRKSDLDEMGAGELVADMVVRYKFFLEKFQSKVDLSPENLVGKASYLKGPFKSLNNKWVFEDLAEGGSKVHFFIDFEFKNKILQTLAMEVFDKVFKRMSAAFIDRAHEIYGA